MRRYRYRTSVLTGPWRTSPDQALRDAAQARQIELDENRPATFRWIVPGEIEEAGPEAIRRADR